MILKHIKSVNNHKKIILETTHSSNYIFPGLWCDLQYISHSWRRNYISPEFLSLNSVTKASYYHKIFMKSSSSPPAFVTQHNISLHYKRWSLSAIHSSAQTLFTMVSCSRTPQEDWIQQDLRLAIIASNVDSFLIVKCSIWFDCWTFTLKSKNAFQ